MAVPLPDRNSVLEALPQVKKVFVVLNPVAGLTDASSERDTIVEFCKSVGWEADIHETTPDDDLQHIVKSAIDQGVDLVLAAGGDGTVSGVVSGMVGTGVPMGILPAGTGNALARDLGIPLALDQALALLCDENRIQPLDVMETNGDFFVLNVSVGLSAIIMRRTAREEKRRYGFLAYIWRGIGSVVHSDLHRFQVTVDDHTYRFSASEVLITNTRLLGFSPNIEGVNVDPNDGRVDMFIVRAKSARDFMSVLTKVIAPRPVNGDDKLQYLEVKDRVRIESEFPLPVQADGEEIGVTPVEMHLIPSALHVVVPIPEA